MFPSSTSGTLVNSLPIVLSSEKEIVIDSGVRLIQAVKTKQLARKKAGYQGPTKSPVGVTQFAKPKAVGIKPLDLLLAIGRITTPIVPNLVDLSSAWALYRYVWAFAERPKKLWLSQTTKEKDFHQKGLLSDEVGIGMAYTLVQGQRLPPAKFSTIAEYVWLLEKTGAPTRFLVFGNDRQVPELWLKRYGSLVPGVAFYFLSDNGPLEQLAKTKVDDLPP